MKSDGFFRKELTGRGGADTFARIVSAVDMCDLPALGRPGRIVWRSRQSDVLADALTSLPIAFRTTPSSPSCTRMLRHLTIHRATAG